jgi:S-formylglutathione hydrolase
MTIVNLAVNKVSDGWHKQYSHRSITLNCDMRFAVFLPPQATNDNKVPVLYWLSGLTCTDENFMQKAGAFRKAAELGIAIVAPDTSPRGEDIANDDAYDLGQGAGFYVNATQSPWDSHYKMYDYIVDELPKLIEATFPVSGVRAISGHSMGGHGALTIGLKNSQRYRSISAFSPITNPINCPWGQKAFTTYLGDNKSAWQEHDSCYLLAQATTQLPIRIDQGLADEFLEQQLLPKNLEQAAKNANYPLAMNYHDGFDHSYYFISSFIEQHLEFHNRYLR